MNDLTNPKNTISILQAYHFRFQKKYGQNFLVDTHVLDKILSAANVSKEDFVLEIGPGIGTMTQALCQCAREVAAVEIDKYLIPILHETLKDYSNVEIIQKDILKVDISRLAHGKNGGKPIKVIANLPYYITTPVIMELLKGGAAIGSMTVMAQKEVAARMQAKPGTKEYGALSLAVQYYTLPQIAANVPPNCFLPRPKVASAVIHLERRKEPAARVEDEGLLFAIIRASFNQRRKTLANGLHNSGFLALSKQQIENCIRRLGLPAAVRGESLSLAQFAQLSDLVYNEIHTAK